MYRLRIDTLCHEGLVSQKVVRFSHLTFRKQNMSQTVQNKDQFGLHWQALRVKDGTMSTLQGSLHSPIKADFSVVLFRSDFVLTSEDHLMKTHKNQWLPTFCFP